MEENILKIENIEFVDSFKTWEDAVYFSTKNLIKGGYAEEKYPEEIIKNTYKLGAYYVLCEDFALVHASNEQGAIQTQISVTICKEPIYFVNSTVPVRLVITLVAVDSFSHLNFLKSVADLFQDANNIQRIIASKSKEEVYQILTTFK